MKKLEDVVKIIQTEISSIKKRDGELDKTPYVVLEIIDRLKTIDWEGRDTTKSIALSIRGLVEFCIQNPKAKPPSSKPMTLKTIYEDAEAFFEPDPELEVDWDDKGSVEKYSNTTLNGSKKNLVKSARREEKKRLKTAS